MQPLFSLTDSNFYYLSFFMNTGPDAQKYKQMKKNLKITVNTGQIMFSAEIYYY